MSIVFPCPIFIHWQPLMKRFRTLTKYTVVLFSEGRKLFVYNMRTENIRSGFGRTTQVSFFRDRRNS